MLIRDEADIIDARRAGKRLGAEIGFSPVDQTMLASVLTELGRNLIDHAGGGELLVQALERDGRRGIEVIARDQGPGIPHVPEALQSTYTVAGGLGLGLKGVKAIMDSFDITSVPGKRTTVIARKWRK